MQGSQVANSNVCERGDFGISSLTPVWTRAGVLLRHAARLRYEFFVECAPGERERERKRERTSALIREQTKDTIIIFIDGGGGGASSGRGGMSMYGIFISGGILRS